MLHIDYRCCGHLEVARPNETHLESQNVMNFRIVQSEYVLEIISFFVKTENLVILSNFYQLLFLKKIKIKNEFPQYTTV